MATMISDAESPGIITRFRDLEGATDLRLAENADQAMRYRRVIMVTGITVPGAIELVIQTTVSSLDHSIEAALYVRPGNDEMMVEGSRREDDRNVEKRLLGPHYCGPAAEMDVSEVGTVWLLPAKSNNGRVVVARSR